MNCPKCAVPLVQREARGRLALLDYCPKCQGIWFDDGELTSITGLPARNLSVPAGARPSAMQCPRCAEPLALFPYPGTMTLIDACRSCSGVWLDGGEYQQLAKIGAAVPAPHLHAQAQPSAQPPEPETGGLKASMIGFIDRSIASLWEGIRS
jgi:Zn-finger nucleic acid-binding protein